MTQNNKDVKTTTDSDHKMSTKRQKKMQNHLKLM